MEKNWLIRTEDNHILGPVSKAKVKELVENGSIKGGDELCSGNGFWFYVRESDMVEKYLKSDEEQPFNPVSEAQTVLAENADAEESSGLSTENEADDITTVGLNLNDFNLDGGEDEKKK